MARDATDTTDTANPLDAFRTFYWGNNPNINQELRQRIALQMMSSSKGKGFPKTIGEGLSAVGDSLGDIGLAKMLERGDLSQQEVAKQKAEEALRGPPVAAAAPGASASNAMAYAPPP